MTTFGLCIFGPIGSHWYHFLDKRFPGTATAAILKKVACDQFIFAPPFYASFYLSMALFEGKSLLASLENVKKNFVTTYLVDLAFWPAAQTVNFRVVPTDQRMLFIGTLSIGWNAFLSYMQHKH